MKTVLVVLVFVAIGFAETEIETDAEINIEGSHIGPKEEVNDGIIYQVSLLYSQKKKQIHFCSGIIVSEYWILTTARCVHNFADKIIIAAYGSRFIDGPFKFSSIERVSTHPKFNSADFLNDIAMLLTKTKIEFQKNLIAAIQLPSGTYAESEAFAISGWGIKCVCTYLNYSIFERIQI